MNIDQSRQDQLAARIDRLNRGAFEVGSHACYVTLDNAYIAYGTQSTRWINYVAAFNNQIVFRRAGRECARNSRNLFNDRAQVQQLAPIHIGPLYSRFRR